MRNEASDARACASLCAASRCDACCASWRHARCTVSRSSRSGFAAIHARMPGNVWRCRARRRLAVSFARLCRRAARLSAPRLSRACRSSGASRSTSTSGRFTLTPRVPSRGSSLGFPGVRARAFDGNDVSSGDDDDSRSIGPSDGASRGGGADGNRAASVADAKARVSIVCPIDASDRGARPYPRSGSASAASLEDLRTDVHGRHPRRRPPDAADSVTSETRLSEDAPSPGRTAAVDAVAARNTARARNAHRAASRAAMSSRAPRGTTESDGALTAFLFFTSRLT